MKEKHLGWRLIAAVAFCVLALFYFDDSPELEGTRRVAVDGSSWVLALAAGPARLIDAVGEYFQSRERLRQDNQRLLQENLVLQGRTQRLAGVLSENARYRALLNSAELIQNDIMVAEVLSVVADPAHHMLVLDKGAKDGVFIGQPMLGAEGLLGQVTLVGEQTSRAILISDASHAVPVQVMRNGVRALAEGTGSVQELLIRHLAATTDIEVGDVLVTSGLGGRFPPNYPVAKVVEINLRPEAAFALVRATPLASLDRGRHVLLALAPAEMTAR